MDTTLKIGKLSSLEEIAVGIAGERPAKSGALSHYEDRRERKGWLVEGVHGISIARRNNWVQSGRLPYVTSAPFKRESAFASSSSSLILSHPRPRPRPTVLPILEQPRSLPPRRQKDQLDAREREKKKRDQKKATTGRSVRGRGKDGRGREGEEGQEEEKRQKGDGEQGSEGGRGRHGSGRKEEHAHTVETGAGDQGRCWYQSPLSVTEKEEGRNRGRRTPKNDLAVEEGGGGGRGATGPLNKNNAMGNTEQKQREGRAKQPSGSEKGEES